MLTRFVRARFGTVPDVEAALHEIDDPDRLEAIGDAVAEGKDLDTVRALARGEAQR